MSVVDDYGRTEAHVMGLVAKCYPLQLDKVTVEDVSKWLGECSANSESLVQIYTVKGKKYLQIKDFGQRIRSPKYPGPEESDDPCEHLTATGGNPPHSAARATPPPPNTHTHTITPPPPNTSGKGVQRENQKLDLGPLRLAVAGFTTCDEKMLGRIMETCRSSASVTTPEDASWVATWSISDKAKIRGPGLFLTAIPEFARSKLWQDLRWLLDASVPIVDRVQMADKVLSQRTLNARESAAVQAWFSEQVTRAA